METHSDSPDEWDDLRNRIIGLGERSIRKSYYPELEQRLAEMERFRALLDQSNDLIFLVEIPSGRFADVNESACRQLGFLRQKILAMSIGDLVPKPVLEMISALFVNDGQAVKTIVTTFHRNEGELPVEISLRRVAFKNIVYAVIVARDITERQLMEENLRKHREQLEELVQERTAQLTAINQELEAFSYSVAHDLRTPLRAINGFSNILLNEHSTNIDSAGLSYLQHIIESGQHMNQIIDALLSLSHLTRSEMRREKVDLSAMARLILNEFHQRDPQRNVKVIIADGLVIEADHQLIRVVLENLLGNAWKFTAKIPNAFIELGAQAGKPITYFVRDNGAGFDMNYASKLFGAFQRLHSEGEYSGTGIGLAIVKRIIHRHNGEVWAVGEVGKGATFYFTVP